MDRSQRSPARSRWQARLRRALGPAILVLAVACSDSAAPDVVATTVRDDESKTVIEEVTASVVITALQTDETAEVDAVEVLPSSIVLDPEETVALSAAARDREGRPITDAQFIWSVIDPRAGSIAPDGEFRAGLTPGIFTGAISITVVQNTPAGIRQADSTATVTIVGEEPESSLTSIEILPSNPTVLSGQIYRLRAVGFTRDGRVISGVSFAWQVNDPDLGRINDLGYLTVVGEARKFQDALSVTGVWRGVTVSATTDLSVLRTPKAEDFMEVQVLPRTVHLDPGVRLQMRAVTLNGLGELVTGTQLRWSLDQGAVGAIDGSGQFIAGDTPGVYTRAVRVEAILPGEQGLLRAVDYASVVIRKTAEDRPLEAVQALPSSMVLSPGSRALPGVRGVDTLGQPVSGLVTSWAVSPVIGEIDEHGSFVAFGAPGRYPGALVATVEQHIGDDIHVRTASLDVTITGVLSEVEITPSLATISQGRTTHFRITGRDENGVPLSGLVVRWSIGDERIGTIDDFGNFTAGDQTGVYQDSIRARVMQTLPKRR